jgi:hypothetical protein
MPTSNIAAFDIEIMAQIEGICTRCYFAQNFTIHLVLHTSRQLCPFPTCEQCCADQLLRHEVPRADQIYSSTGRKNDECLSGGYENYNHHVGAYILQKQTSCEPRLQVLLLLFCRARWLMPPDIPQPVRLIVLNLL